MNYLFKMLAEGIIGELKLFNNNIANMFIRAILLFISFIPAWKSVDFLYDIGLIKSKEEGSFLHWTIRIVVASIVFYILKGIISIINLLFNNWFVLIGVIGLIVIIYAIKKYTKKLNQKERNCGI